MAAFLTLLFITFLLGTTLAKLWLSHRQWRHIAQHRDQVPAEFAAQITLAEHQKAADYSMAKLRLGNSDLLLSTAILVMFTLLGGIDFLQRILLAWLGEGMVQKVALIAAVILIGALLDIPLAWIRQFRLEAQFGFNRMTLRLWFTDLCKSTLLGIVMGVPLLVLTLYLMGLSGAYWWLYAWAVWMGFSVLTMTLYPTVIAPLFNRFEPLSDATLKTRIEALLQRCGFKASGVFVMDGSQRSGHGNAYFTGLGKTKRIVLFDTLMTQLNPDEIEAVLAHELGHFKCGHTLKRLTWSFLTSLVFLALLGWLMNRPEFYLGLGVTPQLTGATSNNGLALLLFFYVLPTFLFPLQPLSSWLSRRHEYEADRYAATQTHADYLVSALTKLYKDNASTLTPDPLYSAVYDSHPPALLRIKQLRPVAR